MCLEAHDSPGGCAQAFDRYSSASKSVPFQFDAGPSLVTQQNHESIGAIGTSDEIEWKTFGLGINPGKEVWELEGATTPIQNFYGRGRLQSTR